MKRKNLKKFRIDIDKTQEDVGRDLGVTKQFISNLENGKVKPSFEFATKFYHCYQEDLERLKLDIWELFKKES